MARGSGISTAQILNAPEGGVYVIPAGSRGYFRGLLPKLGRDDLRIVSMDWIVDQAWRGYDPRLVVVDHACRPGSGVRLDAFLDFFNHRRARLLSLDTNLEEPYLG